MPKTGRRGDFSHFCPCRAFGLTSILTQHTQKSVALNLIVVDSCLLKPALTKLNIIIIYSAEQAAAAMRVADCHCKGVCRVIRLRDFFKV